MIVNIGAKVKVISFDYFVEEEYRKKFFDDSKGCEKIVCAYKKNGKYYIKRLNCSVEDAVFMGHLIVQDFLNDIV